MAHAFIAHKATGCFQVVDYVLVGILQRTKAFRLVINKIQYLDVLFGKMRHLLCESTSLVDRTHRWRSYIDDALAHAHAKVVLQL